MAGQLRVAGLAALFVFVAFAVHLLNIFYFEPKMGFASLADYLSVDKIEVGLRSRSWIWSGYGHFATGIALAVLTAVAFQWMRSRVPTGAVLVVVTGVLAAFAFFSLGLIDLQGSSILLGIEAANPGNKAPAIMAFALLRNTASVIALVALGWFIVQLTWSLRDLNRLPFLFAIFSYVTGLVAFWLFRGPAGMLVAYALIAIWAFGLGFHLFSRADSLAFFEEKYV
jgi:hypothetical protein